MAFFNRKELGQIKSKPKNTTQGNSTNSKPKHNKKLKRGQG